MQTDIKQQLSTRLTVEITNTQYSSFIPSEQKDVCCMNYTNKLNKTMCLSNYYYFVNW